MSDSILTSIKKLIGISEDDAGFDLDLIFHINSVFLILYQIGVGPEIPFSISDKTTTWSDFIPDISKLEAIKTYMFLKVKMIFDPSTSSIVLESQKNLLSELEWRLNLEVDPGFIDTNVEVEEL